MSCAGYPVLDIWLLLLLPLLPPPPPPPRGFGVAQHRYVLEAAFSSLLQLSVSEMSLFLPPSITLIAVAAAAATAAAAVVCWNGKRRK